MAGNTTGSPDTPASCPQCSPRLHRQPAPAGITVPGRAAPRAPAVGVRGRARRGRGRWRPGRGGETLLQPGCLLVQLDRAGMRWELAALGQGGPDPSAGRLLVGLDDRTRGLACFPADPPRLLDGLIRQAAKPLQGLVLASPFPPMLCPAMLKQAVSWLARSSPASLVAALSTTNRSPPPLQLWQYPNLRRGGCGIQLSRYNPARRCSCTKGGPGGDDAPTPRLKQTPEWRLRRRASQRLFWCLSR